MTTAEQAKKMLGRVKDAGSGRSVLELGWLDQIRMNPPRAILKLDLPDFAQNQLDRIAQETKNLLKGLEGTSEVQIALISSLSNDISSR